MSAICGIYYFDREKPVKERHIYDMLNMMSHRGNLDQKIYVKNNIGLGFRANVWQSKFNKLNIQNPRSKVVSAVDGLIYNPEELAHDIDLQSVNYDRVDTSELISAVYEKYGLEMPERINGSFALATIEKDKGNLLLSRDRFGAKPLYYFIIEKTGIVFASEIKGILAISEDKPSLNPAAVKEYLLFRYSAGSDTLFKGIKEVSPGHFIVVDGKGISKKKYWSADDNHGNYSGADFIKNVEIVEELFRDSIKSRIRLGSKISANCSGGIDSGMVTAFSSRLTDAPLNTYCIGFNEKDWDERYYSKLISDKYKTSHSELVITSEIFSRNLENLNWYNDEPLSDPNSVLVYLLAEESMGKTDVLLTGEGADEVFIGYPRYNMLKIYEHSLVFPLFIRNWIAQVLFKGKGHRLKKLATTLLRNKSEALIFNSSFVPLDMLSIVLESEFSELPLTFRANLSQTLVGKDMVSACMLYEVMTYLTSSLNRLDKMNMAVGLEAVTPFLDNKLFDHALSIPNKMNISTFENKLILRKIAKKYLPRENLSMPKSGFGVPLKDWFIHDSKLKGYLIAIKSSPLLDGIFRKDSLIKMIDSHLNGAVDQSEILWLVLNFYLWIKKYNVQN